MAHHPKYDVTDEPVRRAEAGVRARARKRHGPTSGPRSRISSIPGYPAGGRSLHVGNHIRKDLLVVAEPPPGLTIRSGISARLVEVPAHRGARRPGLRPQGRARAGRLPRAALPRRRSRPQGGDDVRPGAQHTRRRVEGREGVEGHLRGQIPHSPRRVPPRGRRARRSDRNCRLKATEPAQTVSSLASRAPPDGSHREPRRRRTKRTATCRAISSLDGGDCEAGWRTASDLARDAQPRGRIKNTGRRPRDGSLLGGTPKPPPRSRFASPISPRGSTIRERGRARGRSLGRSAEHRRETSRCGRRSTSSPRCRGADPRCSEPPPREEMRDVRLGLNAAAPEKPKSVKTRSKAAEP